MFVEQEMPFAMLGLMITAVLHHFLRCPWVCGAKWRSKVWLKSYITCFHIVFEMRKSVFRWEMRGMKCLEGYQKEQQQHWKKSQVVFFHEMEGCTMKPFNSSRSHCWECWINQAQQNDPYCWCPKYFVESSWFQKTTPEVLCVGNIPSFYLFL